MKFVCKECGKLIEEHEVILSAKYNTKIQPFCSMKCVNKY